MKFIDLNDDRVYTLQTCAAIGHSSGKKTRKTTRRISRRNSSKS